MRDKDMDRSWEDRKAGKASRGMYVVWVAELGSGPLVRGRLYIRGREDGPRGLHIGEVNVLF